MITLKIFKKDIGLFLFLILLGLDLGHFSHSGPARGQLRNRYRILIRVFAKSYCSISNFLYRRLWDAINALK